MDVIVGTLGTLIVEALGCLFVLALVFLAAWVISKLEGITP